MNLQFHQQQQEEDEQKQKQEQDLIQYQVENQNQNQYQSQDQEQLDSTLEFDTNNNNTTHHQNQQANTIDPTSFYLNLSPLLSTTNLHYQPPPRQLQWQIQAAQQQPYLHQSSSSSSFPSSSFSPAQLSSLPSGSYLTTPSRFVYKLVAIIGTQYYSIYAGQSIEYRLGEVLHLPLYSHLRHSGICVCDTPEQALTAAIPQSGKLFIARRCLMKCMVWGKGRVWKKQSKYYDYNSNPIEDKISRSSRAQSARPATSGGESESSRPVSRSVSSILTPRDAWLSSSFNASYASSSFSPSSSSSSSSASSPFASSEAFLSSCLFSDPSSSCYEFTFSHLRPIEIFELPFSYLNHKLSRQEILNLQLEQQYHRLPRFIGSNNIKTFTQSGSITGSTGPGAVGIGGGAAIHKKEIRIERNSKLRAESAVATQGGGGGGRTGRTRNNVRGMNVGNTREAFTHRESEDLVRLHDTIRILEADLTEIRRRKVGGKTTELAKRRTRSRSRSREHL